MYRSHVQVNLDKGQFWNTELGRSSGCMFLGTVCTHIFDIPHTGSSERARHDRAKVIGHKKKTTVKDHCSTLAEEQLDMASF